MFKVDVTALATAANGVLRETQDIRLAHERTSAALSAVLPTAGGQWYKTGSLATSQFKRDLGDLKSGLISLSDAFAAASSEARGTLLPQYRMVLNAMGASAAGLTKACLDEDVAVDSSYQYACDSIDALRNKIGEARGLLAGLEGSWAIGLQLDAMDTLVGGARGRIDQTQGAFVTYRASVRSFEGTYATRFDPSTFMKKDYATRTNNNVKDTKSFFSILKHGFSLGGTFGKIASNTWEPSKTKPFAEGFSAKMGDWARPDKWRDSWQTAKGISNPVAGVADDVGEAVSDVARWSDRANAIGKLAGYVGDGLSVFGIATSTVKSFSETEGDEADKAAAATYTAVTGAAKFATGKAVGAAVGTMVGGPVGTAVGFVAGCAVDLAWDYASDWMEESGAKDAILETVSGAYREAGKFITSGFDWFAHTFSFGGQPPGMATAP